jgi:hypothetical protein
MTPLESRFPLLNDSVYPYGTARTPTDKWSTAPAGRGAGAAYCSMHESANLLPARLFQMEE